MYVFGMLVFLGLAMLVIARLAHRYLSAAPEIWALALVALGIAAAWFAGFDAFGAWGLDVRNAAIGTTLTGFLIGGAGYFWHEVLHLLGGLGRKVTDEAQSLEKTEQLRRVA